MHLQIGRVTDLCPRAQMHRQKQIRDAHRRISQPHSDAVRVAAMANLSFIPMKA